MQINTKYSHYWRIRIQNTYKSIYIDIEYPNWFFFHVTDRLFDHNNSVSPFLSLSFAYVCASFHTLPNFGLKTYIKLGQIASSMKQK